MVQTPPPEDPRSVLWKLLKTNVEIVCGSGVRCMIQHFEKERSYKGSTVYVKYLKNELASID